MWSDPWDPVPFVQRQPFSVAVPTIYGPMIVHRYDTSLSPMHFRNGVSPMHPEIRFLSRLLTSLGRKNLHILDVAPILAPFPWRSPP